MNRFALLLVAALLTAGAAAAQTAPATNGASTTRSANTTGFGGTVSGTPKATNMPNGEPARYDDRNSGLPSERSVKVKRVKPTSSKREMKMERKTDKSSM